MQQNITRKLKAEAKAEEGGSREQERIGKAEQARKETERILKEQQAEVDRKKADMLRRDAERLQLKELQVPVPLCAALCGHVLHCTALRDPVSRFSRPSTTVWEPLLTSFDLAAAVCFVLSFVVVVVVAVCL